MTHSSAISCSAMVSCLIQNVKAGVNIFWMPSDQVCDLSLFSGAFVMSKRDTPDQTEKWRWSVIGSCRRTFFSPVIGANFVFYLLFIFVAVVVHLHFFLSCCSHLTTDFDFSLTSI